MKRLILILVVFLPITMIAQQTDSIRMNEQPGPGAGPLDVASATPGLTDASLASSANGRSGSFSDPQPAPLPPQTSKATQAQKTKEPSRPPIEGSMVGYIDNPIVGSQIRIRFDDAFEDRFPDRSEFFYAKCGCSRFLSKQFLPFLPSNAPLFLAFDPKAPGPGPGVPTGVPNSINFQQLYMNVEYSPHRRFSAFVEVPIRWLQPQGFKQIPPFPGFSNQSGLSDVQAGFKFAAVTSEGTYLTFQFKSYFPSGDALRGLGTNHYSVEPSLLLYHSFSERWTLEGQIGDWHPIGGSAGVSTTSSPTSEGFAGDVFFYGIGPSYKLYQRNHVRLAPVVELFGWHVLSGFQSQPGGPVDSAATEVSGLNIVNLKVGVRTSIGFRNSFYVGFGQALTHDDWYKHIVRLEYRYSF
ncbi:MAG TPA: transporter [Terriglobales bacterium]|jgi:Putative MetA-pathway of phenol degradation|nr:transporter [Terriglobales bacterium]